MDTLCMKCGEPWDYLGARNGGDMAPWEYALFRQGAGCPSCEGEGEGLGDEVWRAVPIGDDDDAMHQRLAIADGIATAPAWERPEDPIHWVCSGCGVEARTDLDDGSLHYHLPMGARARQWYHSHPFHRSEPDPEPHAIVAGESLCEYCTDSCVRCGAECSSLLDDCAGGYPVGMREMVCGEHCLSEYEHEQSWEAWEQWGASDFVKALAAHLDLSEAAIDLLSEVSCDALAELHSAHEHNPWEWDGEGPSFSFDFRHSPETLRAEVAALLRSERS